MAFCNLYYEINTPKGVKQSQTFKELVNRYSYQDAKEMFILVTKPEFINKYGEWETEIALGRKIFNTELGEPPVDLVEQYFQEKNETKEIEQNQVLDNLKKASEKIVTNLEAQITNLSRSNSENKQDLAERLKTIQKDIQSKRTVIGIVNYVNFAKETMNRYEDLLLNKIDTLEDGYIRNIKNLLDSFEDLEQLEFELESLAKGKKLDDIYDDLEEEEIVQIKPYIAKEILPEIQDLLKTRRILLNKYKDYAIQASASWLSLVTDKLSQTEIYEKLKRMRDIGSINRWIMSMKNVNNPILQLVAKSIDSSKITANQITNNKQEEISEAYNKFINYMQKANPNININNTKELYDIFLEKTEDGKLTGKEVEQYLDKPFRLSLQLMFDSLPEITEDMSEKQIAGVKIERGKIINKWKNENLDMEVYNSFNQDLKKKQKDLELGNITQKEYDKWEKSNVAYGTYYVNKKTGEEERFVYPKFTSKYYKPADKWLSKQWIYIQSVPELKEFYDFYKATKNNVDQLIPYKFRKDNELLSIRKDTLDIFIDKGVKGVTDYYKNNFKLTKLEEYEFGEQNKDGSLVNHVPIFYTSRVINKELYSPEYLEKIKDTYLDIEDVSFDLTKNLAMYVAMGNQYDQVSKIIDNIEMLKDVVADSDILLEDKLGRVLLDKKTLKEKTIKGSASNVMKLLEDYVKMNVYGQSKEMNDAFGMNIKVIDKILGYNSFVTLGFNMFTPVSNLLMGNTVRRISAIGSTYYNNKNFNKAQVYYAKENAWDLINDSFRQQPTHKINQLRKLFQLDTGFKDLTNTKRLLEKNYSRIADEIGEHWLSSVSMLSILDNEGLLDQIKIDKDKLILPESLDNKKIRSLILKIKEEIKSKDGAFRPEDKSAIERYVIGRMMFQFRKWIIPSVLDRFQAQLVDGKLQSVYNHQSDVELKGYYISAGEFGYNIIKDALHAKFQIATRWNDLTDLDKRNLYKFGTELTYMISTGLLAAIIKAANDDDDRTLAYLNFQVNRLNTELAFYLPLIGLKDQLQILKSPTAAVSSFGTMGDMLSQIIGVDYKEEEINFKFNDVYESGKNKGEYKSLVKLQRNIPVINQINRFVDLTEK